MILNKRYFGWMHAIIDDNLLQVQQLMRHYGVEKAYAFGSAVNGTMHENSDIDFIIRFPDNMQFKNYSDNYFALAYALEKSLKRRVDLVTEETLENPYLVQSISSHKIQVL